MIIKEFISHYISLRNRLDLDIKRLENMHSSHMQCSKACYHCCMNFGILPIEAFAIAQTFSNKTAFTKTETNEQCIFLIHNLCSIYEHRPFICRTQGLPIVYEVDNQYQLSVCERNFTSQPDSLFTPDNCLFMDDYNNELYALNIEFLKHNPQLGLQYDTLIKVNNCITILS